MNTRRTLRKAIAGLLKQTVVNTPAVSTSSDGNLVNDSDASLKASKK